MLKTRFFLWRWRKILTKTLGNNTDFVLSFKPFSYAASISFLVKSDQSSCNEGAPVPDWTDCPKLPSSLKISDMRSSQIICTWNYTVNYTYNHSLLLETLITPFNKYKFRKTRIWSVVCFNQANSPNWKRNVFLGVNKEKL